MSNDLEVIISTGDAKDRIALLQDFIDKAVKGVGVVALKTVINRIIAEDVPAQVSKPVILHYAQSISNLPAEFFEDIANNALLTIKNCSINLDEANYILRDHLFTYYIQCGQFSDAAQILAGVNVDSTTKVFTDEEKADIYIKCAESYLEDDQAIDAEVFMNKASPFMQNITTWILNLRYKATLARVLDANRKFLEAAIRYYELSILSHESLVADELVALYVKSIVCSVLGRPSVQRTRLLSLLSQDARFPDLALHSSYSLHITVLEKMVREQLVSWAEVKALEGGLAEHQKAVVGEGAGGGTVLERAVREHNVLALSKLYFNIGIGELAGRLNVDERRAEKIVAGMVAEHRLKGRIDQVQGVVIFGDSPPAAEGGVVDLPAQINNICHDVSLFVEMAREVFPDLQ